MKSKFPLLRLLPTLLLLALACNLPSDLSGGTPTTGAPSRTIPPPSDTPPPLGEPADAIFFNGALVTLEESQPTAEAIALRNGLIQAVGTDEEILALQGPETVVVDLQGNTLMPGFIDGHTHILAFPERKGRSLDEAQETAVRYGFTTVNEMWADQGQLDRLMQAEQEGGLRLRVNVFASYNDGNLDENRGKIFLKTWYPEHGPILDPSRRLRIPGIKIFVDGDNFNPSRGCWALNDPFAPSAPALNNVPCGTSRGDLYWSQEELNPVVLEAQNAGYRVAFHAMGDGAIETALDAIEYALDGQPNANVRHQIEHNSLVSPDQLNRYRTLDVLASVRGYGDFCDLSFLAPTFGSNRSAWYANRYALPGLGIHAYMETDFGWTIDPDDRFSQRSLDPIMQLYGIVTHRYVAEDGTTCEPDPTVAAYVISIERALQMLTIEPAYAVSMEDHVGSLKPGKYADLIMLSGNPLSVDPNELKDLEVWMTMVGGKVEYCAKGREALCPEMQAAVTPEPTASATKISSPTSLPGSVVVPVDTLGKSIPWLPLDKTATPGVNYVGFNTVKHPFDSSLVRRAFAYSIDREVIVGMARSYGANNPAPATTLTPPQTLGRDLYGAVGANFDPQKAKDLLTQAGYSDPSSFPTVTFLVNETKDLAPGARFNMASAMAESWQTHLGIKVEVQAVQSFNEYNNRLKNNPPELFWVGWAADYNDPASFIGEIFNPNGDYRGEFNYGHFSNSEFNELIDRAARSNDPTERQGLYIQAERILCEMEAAIIPIFYSTYNLP